SFQLAQHQPSQVLTSQHLLWHYTVGTRPNQDTMHALTSKLTGLGMSGTTTPTGTVYLIGKTRDQACFLHWSSDQLFSARFSSAPDPFESGKLYDLKRSTRGSAQFSEMTEKVEDVYLNRRDSIKSEGYKKRVLQPLLQGSRVRDFEQSCATVAHLKPLIVTSPTRPGYLKKAQFRADSGEMIDVTVDEVIREGEKSMKMICTPLRALPSTIGRQSRLQWIEGNARIPIVTSALESLYRGTRTVGNTSLLERIYGEPGAFAHCAVDRSLITIRKKNGDDVVLNAEQSEAVRRYLSDATPAFAVESPPGSGKTMTAAAMAVSYSGPGLQLFLSTANVPVLNMAIALDGIDYGTKKIVHLVAADREAAQSEEERSPFSLFVTDDDDNRDIALFKELGEDLETASKRQQRAIKRQMRKAHAAALGLCVHLDVIMATVDMILCKLLKKKDPKRTCPIQAQLETRVRRIVIDEASQLTEAALNVIISCFPKAQIVLIGDSKQLPPFRYVKGDIVSELAAASALEVLKQKRNVPVITLRQVYRAAPSLIKHYSDAFYNGELVSGKPESKKVSLTSLCKGITSRCMFIDVVKSKAAQNGTSKINDAEIGALEFVVNRLRRAGYDHNSVMVIAFYEAQRKLATTRLPDGYEVLTVDSAQGREKDIVIVLTTRDAPTTAAFFTCEKRCNVAMSRQKEALIVLGSKALLTIEPWKRVLKKDYFLHVTYDQ
ncbi:hypothetical protein PENTCL1PPCAC_8753, partial [Pristionchus entomophagus]